MLRITMIGSLLLTLVMTSGCGEVNGLSEERGRVEREDVQREMSEATETTKEYVRQEMETFSQESRARFAEWRSGLKAAFETRSSTPENEHRQRADDLVEKIDQSEKRLDNLKEAGRENWERVKREIQDMIDQIEEEYQELFK